MVAGMDPRQSRPCCHGWPELQHCSGGSAEQQSCAGFTIPEQLKAVAPNQGPRQGTAEAMVQQTLVSVVQALCID